MKLKKINYDFDLNFRLFSIGIMRQVTYDFKAWEVSNPMVQATHELELR